MSTIVRSRAGRLWWRAPALIVAAALLTAPVSWSRIDLETNFMVVKRQCFGKGSALLVELDCGEEIMVDTVKLFRKLPRDVVYRARLLRRTTSRPQGLEHAGCNVWVEA